MYRQGDGRLDIHDWGMEFTAAGLLMQSELLLISRDDVAIPRYIDRLERCANFIETRRDPKNNLFLAGPAGNLLAPSYAGYKKPDGTYGQAYLAALSITYIAGLDQLIELEKLAGRADKAALYAHRRSLARMGLPLLMTDEGYFIKSLDPDGTRHGVYGAAKHGYFEASPNHDAIAFGVVDDAQAQRIYATIASIPGLRPHHFILPNYPSLDDMYEKPAGLWGFGTWVNGGHWSTCEGRMIMAYYRLGKYEDARRSMRQLMTFARRFRMDNPLVQFGSDVYQPNEPINLCYDTFAPAAALVRGLFEYRYRADALTLIPHIPPGITRIEHGSPIRFGTRRLYIAAAGKGPVSAVRLNGEPWTEFDARDIHLPYADLPGVNNIHVAIGFGGAEPPAASIPERPPLRPLPPTSGPFWRTLAAAGRPPEAVGKPAASQPTPTMLLARQAPKVERFHAALVAAGLTESNEAAHARLAIQCVATMRERLRLQQEDKLPKLAETSQTAADRSYIDTAAKLCAGLEKMINGYANATDPRKKRVHQIWRSVSERPSERQ